MTINNEEENLLLRMIAAAQPALRDLVLATEFGPIKDSTYAIKSRTKTFESAKDKIQKKRQDGDPNFGPASLTDVIGLRFITLYREDILKIVTHVCDMIYEETASQPSPFVPRSLDIARVYLSSDSDLTAMKDRALMLIARRFPALKVDFPDRATYSGIHLIGRLRSPGRGRDCPPPYLDGVPIEIQIRSVFEDTWGEIDHPSRYKNKHLAAASAATGATPIVDHHIKQLKQFMDAAAGYADLIKRMVSDLEAQSLSSGAVTKSLNSIENMKSALRHFDVPKGPADEFLHLVSLRDELYEKKPPKTPLEKQRFQAEYEEHAEELRRLEANESRPGGALSLETRSSRAFGYFLKVERALCYLYAESTSNLDSAIELYELVLAKFGRSVSTHYRLGQAYSKQRKVDDSVQHFEKTLELIDQLGSMSVDERMMYSPSQAIDELRWRAQKLLGVQYYKKAQMHELRNKRDERLGWLRKSLDITKLALKHCDESAKLSIYNNLVYYITLYVSALGERDARAGGRERGELESYLKVVQQLLKSGGEVEAPNFAAWHDTVAFVSEFVGKHEDAKVSARQVLKLLLATEGPETLMYSQEDKDFMLQRAWRILDGEPKPPKAKGRKRVSKMPRARIDANAGRGRLKSS